LHNLRTLVLDMNPLVQLKNNTFKPLYRLDVLSMINCELTDIQLDAFRGLMALRELTLTNNMISDLASFFDIPDLDNLKTLILNGNEFSSIREGQLPLGLSKLYVSGCPNLQFIEKHAFYGLIQLESLFLNNNDALSYIAADAIDPDVSLVELDLFNNNLHELDQSLVDWDDLSVLQIHGNPWRCDCHILWMLKELREATAERIVCVSPRHLNGRQLIKIHPVDLACHNYITVHSRLAIGLIILSTAFLLLILLAICIKWRKQLLPCCRFSGIKYVALFNVTDGEDGELTISTEKQHRTSIVRRSTSSLTSPVTSSPPKYERVAENDEDDSATKSNNNINMVKGMHDKNGPPPEAV